MMGGEVAGVIDWEWLFAPATRGLGRPLLDARSESHINLLAR